MAKKSSIARDEKRKKMIQKYAAWKAFKSFLSIVARHVGKTVMY